MSLIPQLGDGYYDDTGNWQRTKFCFVQCQHCTCVPPAGLYYSAAHDKRLSAADCLPFGVMAGFALFCVFCGALAAASDKEP